MVNQLETSGVAEAIVLVKAAPQVGVRHGETVCCAALDIYGKWIRLYPVSFRHLDDGRKFGRWDRIRFRWRIPKDDSRPESRRIDQDSLQILGKLRSGERERFLSNSIVTSLEQQRRSGLSLALLRSEIQEFRYERKKEDELQRQQAKFNNLRRQRDLLNSEPLIPYAPAPYKFKYRYRCDDGIREGTCQDWEIEATFFRWSRQYGERQALDLIVKKFGDEYPRIGMLLAMGTHSLYPDRWLVNGILRLDEIRQLTLF